MAIVAVTLRDTGEDVGDFDFDTESGELTKNTYTHGAEEWLWSSLRNSLTAISRDDNRYWVGTLEMREGRYYLTNVVQVAP